VIQICGLQTIIKPLRIGVHLRSALAIEAHDGRGIADNAFLKRLNIGADKIDRVIRPVLSLHHIGQADAELRQNTELGGREDSWSKTDLEEC
jgi:hypothetical protein